MRLGNALANLPYASFLMGEEDILYYNKIGVRGFILQSLSAVYLIVSGYMIWRTIGILCNTPSPIVVVLSESMEPGFKRGDILFLANWKREIKAGDICVFRLVEKEIPVVHRVIERFYEPRSSDSVQIMTKGDNNRQNDLFLYENIDRTSLKMEHIENFVYGSLPVVGMMTIWMNAYPGIKYLVVLIMFLDLLTTKEEVFCTGEDDSTEEKKKKQL